MHGGGLLLARLLLAFGASAGSVAVQTMLRDLYQGARLAAVFARAGAVLALSPELGPPLGAFLVAQWGHLGVFGALCLLAAQTLLSLAFGCAIPNLLSAALQHYRAVQGSAGALLGLQYYWLIAAGLGLIGQGFQPEWWYQPLIMVLLVLLMLPAWRRLG